MVLWEEGKELPGSGLLRKRKEEVDSTPAVRKSLLGCSRSMDGNFLDTKSHLYE